MSEPVRTCVACRTRRPQRALVRLRRRSDGLVVPAVGRRHARGRSAYLCPSRPCFEQAARRHALERALGRKPATADQSPSSERSSSSGSGSAHRAGGVVATKPRSTRVRSPELEVLWPSVVAALDQELQNMQRSGDIRQSPRYGALQELRRGLGEPGRSA